MKKSSVVKGLTLSVVLIFGVVCIFYSEMVKQGVSNGLSLCANTLIPSLFIFLCLSHTAVAYSEIHIPLLSKAYAAVFHAPENTAVLFLLSLIGGYPVGAMLCAQMLEEKKITAAQAKRLPLYCCCSGPAFAVLAVGETMCGSKSVGLILLASTVLSQCIIGIVIGFFHRKQYDCKVVPLYTQTPSFAQAFTASVDKSIGGILHICAYVVLFSVLLCLMRLLPLPAGIQTYISAVLEVTTGAENFKDNVPMLGFILGFGGVSVLFQIKKYLSLTGTNVFLFLLSRLAGGGLSFLICKGLLYVFPQALPTLAAGLQVRTLSFSAPLSAVLVMSFCVFVMSDKF